MAPVVQTSLPEVTVSLTEALEPQLADLRGGFAHDAEVIALPVATAYRFQCRVHGTDIPVIFDTLVGLYHLPPVPLPPRPVIVDLGANIGCTMVHYALYPNARIVGVELDADNVRLASINPGFPIWSWYSTPQNRRRALIFLGSDARNPATEGDTLWVRKSPSRSSSPSMGF